jgi:hypothetical protein
MRRGRVEKRSGPGDALLILLSALPTSVHVQHEVGIAVRVGGVVRRDPCGLAAEQADEDLTMGGWELARILDDDVEGCVVQTREVVRLPVIARAGREQRVKRALPPDVGLRAEVCAVGAACSPCRTSPP